MGRGPGIRVVGKNSIQVDFVWNNQRCRERLRLAPTKENLNYVKRLKAVIEHEIAVGTFEYGKHFPRSAKARVAVGTPLRVSLLQYVDSLAAELEPETVSKYRKDAHTVAGWFGTDVTLRTLTRPLAREAINNLQLSKKRIFNLLTPLRGAIKQAVDDGDLMADPLLDLKVRRTRRADQEKPRPFTPEELSRLARTSLGDLWVAWAWSGLRPGEIIGLQPADVDLIAGTLYIRRSIRVGRTKAPKTTAGERIVTLLSVASGPYERAVKRAEREGKPTVFWHPNTNKPFHEDRAVARLFREACKAADVAYRAPKHLRHTYASMGLSAGENPMWVSKQMGHKDASVVFRVYAKWIKEADQLAGTRMSAKAI